MAKKTFPLLVAGLCLLALLEAVRVYFIMPFAGSQLDDAASLSRPNAARVGMAYWLHQSAPWLRAMGLLLLITPFFWVITKPANAWHRWLAGGLAVVYGGILYLVNYELMADRMFLPPTTKRMVPMSQNKIPAKKLVLGVVENSDARAYPIQLIGYHHQVRDTVGGKPMLITYCTVCRTGRVYDPVVAGKPETFRLVGMDHFNALFEDETTGSWWRQATGEAVMWPRRGQVLTGITARQMTLAEWAIEHPNTLVMQPDPAFRAETDSLATYDLGVGRGKLTGRDPVSWQRKSWVVGVVAGGASKAFDWNGLVKKRVVNEVVGQQPIVLTLAPDGQTFRVFSRDVTGRTLTFLPGTGNQFTDRETGSAWSGAGRATAGPLVGQRLTAVQAYQEFWHSWHLFHPATGR